MFTKISLQSLSLIRTTELNAKKWVTCSCVQVYSFEFITMVMKNKQTMNLIQTNISQIIDRHSACNTQIIEEYIK